VKTEEGQQMKYIIILFFLSISLSALGVVALIDGSFEESRWLQILFLTGPGFIVSGIYLGLYIYLLFKLRKRMQDVKVHSFLERLPVILIFYSFFYVVG